MALSRHHRKEPVPESLVLVTIYKAGWADELTQLEALPFSVKLVSVPLLLFVLLSGRRSIGGVVLSPPAIP